MKPNANLYTKVMANKTVRYLILSQLSLYIFLGICSIINPAYFFSDGGVSNYGVQRSTVVPFSLAFLISGAFLIMATRFMPTTPKMFQRVRCALWLQAFLLFAVLFSTYPYMLNQSYKYIHIAIGALLLVFNLVFVAWVTLRLYRDSINGLLLTLEFIGFLMTFFTLLGLVQLLFIAQVLTSLTFGVFIIRLGERITSEQV